MALPDLTQRVQKETLSLSDGTGITLERTPGVSDNEWEETKRWLEGNPEEARRMEMYTKDAANVRAHLQTQALADYYQGKLGYGDEQVTSRLVALEKNPEFAHIFEEIKRGGPQAAMAFYYNEPLMMKMSRAVGGVPEEARQSLEKVQSNPITFQEACKWGHLATVRDYIKANGQGDVDAKDSRGITGLAYAVGANRAAVVKELLESKADASKVDTSGGTALHYAAAYGRKELAEHLLACSPSSINAKNAQGQTPLALAAKNKQTAVAEFLKGKGAQQ